MGDRRLHKGGRRPPASTSLPIDRPYHLHHIHIVSGHRRFTSNLPQTTCYAAHEPPSRLHRPRHLPHHPLNTLYYNIGQITMAAPRASSFKALRNLQRTTGSTLARRSLHITGVHESSRPLDPNHKTTYMPWNLQDLRHECQRRTLSASGTQHELIDRLAGHDSLQARAFSIASRRIAAEQTKKPVSGYVTAACAARSFKTDSPQSL